MNTLTPIEYLDSLLIDYTLLPHSTAFTTQETAESAHIKGCNLSKVVIYGNESKLVMMTIPADCMLVKESLSRLLKIPDSDVVAEHLFVDRFPECETGAMPPFGKLYAMDVYLARDLVNNEFITFNGGTHNLLIKMRMQDFLKLTEPRIFSVGYQASNPYSKRENIAKNVWR